MNESKSPSQRARSLRALLVLAMALTMLPGAALAAPAAQTAPCASIVTVAAGDTLSLIAGRTLGNQNGWTLIVAATNAQAEVDASFARIADPNRVSPGVRLCIPATGSSVARVTPSVPVASPTPAAPASATVAVTPAATPTAASASQTNDAGNLAVDDDPRYEVVPEELTIEWLREVETPGSEIVIEQVLAPGSNYARYVASYLSEGNKNFAYLTVPQGTAPESGWPVVLFNHGYIPPDVYRTTERYIAYQDAFARNGYIVFRPDYRGHGSSEGLARGGYGYPDYTLDVLNALASVQKYEGADPDRIGLWGHSMGGYIALRAMVARPEIKAGVIWAGVVASYADLINNWTRTNRIPPSIPQRARRWRQVLQEEVGTPEQNPTFWASISANSYLEDLAGPLQVHHGTADGDVPVEFSRGLEQQVNAVGGEVEYFEYAGDDHNLSGSLGLALQRSVDFFDDHVKNAP